MRTANLITLYVNQSTKVHVTLRNPRMQKIIHLTLKITDIHTNFQQLHG